MYYEFEENEILTIDLHGMKVWEATLYLSEFISEAPKNIKEIVVIHGYHGGIALQQMVRKDFSNKRIRRKILGINQGVTNLILN